MNRRRAGVAMLVLLALVLVAGSQARLLAHPLEEDAGRRLLYLPNGRFLQVASLGYPTFVADMIYLWSIQFYGGYSDRMDRFAYLEHVYGQVIARLDPRYVDPYLVGALIMVIEKKDVEGALKLLDQGMAANPKDWLMPYEAGFWAYDTAHDFDRAADYFRRTMEIPGAPASTRRLHAGMLNKKGDKATSLLLWSEILAEAGEDRVRATAANHVHDLQIDVDLGRLNDLAARFQARAGRPPRGTEELVTAGLLPGVPLDSDGRPYVFDPVTGEARSTSPFRLRRR
jgi:tetratricopeptide (TPR) repeat protein